jgi:hypothetical protein
LKLLASYPRPRPPLGPEYRAIYVEHYRANRAGFAARRLESWMHRAVAGGGGPLLEVGAGSFNHVPYETAVEVYDAVEPFRDLSEGSAWRARVRRVYDSIAEVDGRYARIVSVAVLEHLTDLPWIVARCGLLLEPGGRFQAGIPSEGALLWGIGWRAVAAPAFRRRFKLSYAPMVRHEHVNSAREVLAVVRHFFDDVRVRRFPTPLFHLSFYTAVEARGPRVERCRAYCDSRPPAEER